MKINKAVLNGSLLLLIAFNIFNFLNFVFQFSMARMLSAAEYGMLATLFSIIYISSIFSESIQTVVTKYVSTEKSDGKVKNFVKRALSKSSKVTLLLLLAYFVLSIPLSFILRIDYLLLALNGLVISTALLIPITRGLLQGRKRFKSLGVNLIVESTSKVLFAVLLVWMFSLFTPSLKLYGAVIGLMLSIFLAFGFSFVSIRKIMQSRESHMKTPNIYNHIGPIFFVTVAIIAFYSFDIIIAKIFFDNTTAGYYAIAAVLAKAVFWGTQPISKAMFPISSESSKKKSSPQTFLSAFVILVVCILAILTVLYFFSDLIVTVFKGESVEASASILFYLAIAMAFLSLSNLILLYKVSQGVTKGYFLILIPIIIEIILLSLFSSNLLEFSFALIASSIIFLLSSLLVLKK